MTKITKRHNEIARVITDGIRGMLTFDTPPLNNNSTVFIPDVEPLPERSCNFKPDIWFYSVDERTQKKTFTVIEISCPYGILIDPPSGRDSSLCNLERRSKSMLFSLKILNLLGMGMQSFMLSLSYLLELFLKKL